MKNKTAAYFLEFKVEISGFDVETISAMKKKKLYRRQYHLVFVNLH